MHTKWLLVYICIICLFREIVTIETTETVDLADSNSQIQHEKDTFQAKITEEVILTDSLGTWYSEGYPNPYLPTASAKLILKSDPGYYILVTVKALDLDGASRDLLLIKPGKSMEDPGAGIIFTYILKSEREYLINSNEAYLSFEVYGKNTPKRTGFKLTYQRFGDTPVTTTFATTIEDILPTPAVNDSIHATVYLSGITAYDFYNDNVKRCFGEAIALMATDYCKATDIEVIGNITYSENVFLDRVIQCPYNWPQREKCVEVYYHLPVPIDENTMWSGYELTTAHLDLMWTREPEKYLGICGISVYKEPHINQMLTMWIVIICIIIVVLVVSLWAIRIIITKLTKSAMQKRHLSDTVQIVTKGQRISEISLGPHPLQSTPPLFETAFPMFEPDAAGPPPAYGADPDTNDYEYLYGNDSSDDDVLNIAPNSMFSIGPNDTIESEI